jgi:hypothetical protein
METHSLATLVTLRTARDQGGRSRVAMACAGASVCTRHLFPEQETLYAPHRPVKCQVVSFCFIASATQVPLVGGGGTQLYVLKITLTWSPLTESNRRPSPYHVSLRSSAAPGRSSDLRGHEHTLALASAGGAHTSAICHSICHSLDLADEPSDVVADIRFDDPAIRVHGLSPRFTSANRLRSARRAAGAAAAHSALGWHGVAGRGISAFERR